MALNDKFKNAIGLFGGTFDPIHEGHTHLAKELLKKYAFKKILFIPNAQNPLKQEKALASAELRLQMIENALKDLEEPRFEVSRIEMDRPAPSYMIDTVDSLKKKYQEPLVLILGNEVFQTIEKWKEAKRLLELVSVIVLKRDLKCTVNIEQVLKNLHTFSQSNKSLDVEEFATMFLDLSSTEIRKALQEAWKKDHLRNPVQGIQRSVWLFIKVNKLYAR